MKTIRRAMGIMLGGVTIFALSYISLAGFTGAAWADLVYLVRSDGLVEPVDTENPGPHAMLDGEPVPMPKANGIAFTVSYTDVQSNTGFGFDDPTYGAARRARVNDVLVYFNSVLNETGACNILFERSVDIGSRGNGILAATGTYFTTTPGFTNGYAFQDITTGVAPSNTVSDIDGYVDFGWNWYQGTGTTPSNQVDLTSVLLHEMTHGLGFLSLSTASGSSGQARNVYSVFDSYLRIGTGVTLFAGSPPSFMGTRSNLLGSGGGIVFVGTNALAAYGSYPQIYTPNPYVDGTSISHWDPSIPGVMDPAIGDGQTRRQYAPVDLGALQDLGYTTFGTALPTAAFTANLTSGTAPLTISFTDQSTPGDAPITSWAWTFGDSGTSTVQNPTHIYAQPGTYTVSLTVTTTIGSNVATKSSYISVTTITFTVTPAAGPGGSILPNAPVKVVSGGSQTFTIAPNVGHHIADVLVDAVSVGAITTYTFSNVTAPHSIAAQFAANTYTLTPTAGANGSIAPNTPVTLPFGGSQTFTMTPDTGYHVATVLVDNASVGAVTTYTFSNVAASHTIAAQFAVDIYTLTPTAGKGGAISPATPVQVSPGGSQTFTITPNTGYAITNVMVDGVSIGVVTTYTFSDATVSHTIAVQFALVTFTLTPSASSGGSIKPSGAVQATAGDNQTFTITPYTGYHIADVQVDGVSVGAPATYTFTNVRADHSIAATFAVNMGGITTGCSGATLNTGGSGPGGKMATLLMWGVTAATLAALGKRNAIIRP